MKTYSIIKVGNDYVVQAADRSILRTASRRMALRLVAEASELLDLSALPEVSPVAGTPIAGERSEVS
jgi:hypothetical protein